MIYFDHNATTPLDERVYEAMVPYLTSLYGNPSSLYRIGRIARSAIEAAREQVAALVGAQPSQVLFTSGGTEANNLAIKGLAKSLPLGGIAAGATEHPSVLEPIASLKPFGWKVDSIAVDSHGKIDESAFHQLLAADELRFVSIMAANNETGVIQDLAGLSDKLRAHNIFLHCDAVQAAGKIPVDFKSIGAHLLSLSSHKIYGPKGVGALLMDKTLELEPLLHGGGQEKGFRGGTENVAAIVGFGKAAEIAVVEMQTRRQHILKLRHKLEAVLEQMTEVTVFSRDSERLPNTVQFGVSGIDGEMLLMELDRRGIAVSSGSACSSGGNEPSHVLIAMGRDEFSARSAVRLSFGVGNTESEVDSFLSVLNELLLR